MSLGVSLEEEKAFFNLFFIFFVCVGFWFVNNWNPIFKIHFLIFLNFLGNQMVDMPLFCCYCVYGHFGNFDDWVIGFTHYNWIGLGLG